MRELEARTGVNRETIRYYIREGLVPDPERPKRNVAVYDDRHVVRIRAVKELQEKRFLPLAVIRDLLNTDSAEQLLAGKGLEGIEYLLPRLLQDVEASRSGTVEEVAAKGWLDEGEIREMARGGIIEIAKDDRIEARDVAITEQWGRLRARGFTEEDGFGLGFLQLYQRLAQQLSRIEIARFVDAYESKLDSEQAARKAADGLDIVNQILNLMHSRCVIEEFHRVLAGSKEQSTLTGDSGEPGQHNSALEESAHG